MMQPWRTRPDDAASMNDAWWEWWSSANNLVGCFPTREQLVEAVAKYVAEYGWEAAKHVVNEIAGGPWLEERSTLANVDNPDFITILGPELLAEACTYG